MKTLHSKKAQVQSIAPAVLALVFAAIVLVFGLIITQSLRDTPIVATDPGSAGVEINESVNSNFGLTRTLNASAKFPNGGCTGIFTIYNTSSGIKIIEDGNWSLDGCVLTNLSNTYNTNVVGKNWLVTYNYSRGGEAFVSGNKTIQGLGTFADFWEIIVLAIVITVVIGLLLVIFGGRGRR